MRGDGLVTRRDLAVATAAALLTIAALLALAPQAVSHAPTPRPAQQVDGLVPWPTPAARTGAPEALATDPASDSSAKRRAPRPDAHPAAASPGALSRPGASAGALVSKTSVAGSTPAPVATSGTASFMDPSYGASYLALPSGPGHRVLICSVERCVTRTSTDAGPDLAMQRAGRVADLSYRDAAFLCGCDPYIPGLITVEVRR